MKPNSPAQTSLSRRSFVRSCAAGTVALATTSAWGALAGTTTRGPAQLVYDFNHHWLFGGRVPTSGAPPADSAFTPITLPHCVTSLSWENWDPATWQDVWLYRRHFNTLKEFKDRRVFLKFDGVMTSSEATFNGTLLCNHKGGYLPFTCEVTSLLKDSDNLLEMKVDGRWQSVPPEGSPRGYKQVDYFVPAGIIRGASLYAVPQIYISDVFAKPVDVMKPTRRIEVTCTLDAAIQTTRPLHLETKLMEGDRVVASARKQIKIDRIGATELTLTLNGLQDIKLWDVDAPHLYDVVTTLSMEAAPVHDHRTRIGIRDASFTVDGFFLNGRRLHLFGLDRHEIYPYTGYAMPSRVMRRDAEIIKHDFNCNSVRCSHYPQTESFLDACDELGLMVWEETPGWQFIGDDDFHDQVVQNVGDMVRRDRNHASIIVWGVRVNESADDQPLYRRTTALAKSLDDSRPTSGSMTHTSRWETDWHEDVFALDDYHQSPDGTVQILAPLPGVPYMLAETVGQRTYTQKGFDNVYRRAADPVIQYKQALYHAQAQDRALAYPRMCGVIAWCAFEYESPGNSHKGVKNPGIADVFRAPKLGASFYQTQGTPEVRPMIVPNFYWQFGPETPHGPGDEAIIFSNCDQLKLYIDGKLHSTLDPDRKDYPNLKHAPFFAKLSMEGENHPELRIDGFVKGRHVLSRSFSSDTNKDVFMMSADDLSIAGDGIDATRVLFQVTDKFGAPRFLAGGDVKLEAAGPAVLVGDSDFSLTESGGVGAVWLKSKPGTTGRMTLKATHSTFGAKSVSVEVLREKTIRRI